MVAASLGATAFFSLATALKHRSAGQTPSAQRPGIRRLGRFLVATVRHPLWLGGILADVGGLGLQVSALHLGALAVVQPLMITALLFSLVLNHRVAGTRIAAREVAGGAVLVAALAAFLYVSGASSPRITGPPQAVDRTPTIAIGLVAVVLGVACVVIGRRLPHGRGAALVGVAVGLTYACTAALIKSCSNIVLDHGPRALLTSWQLYAVLLAGVAGLVLSQLAFQAGPLRASLPAIATVDPLVSILLGVLAYDEHLRPGSWAITGEILCLAMLCAAAIYLSRLTGVEEAPERRSAKPGATTLGPTAAGPSDPGR